MDAPTLRRLDNRPRGDQQDRKLAKLPRLGLGQRSPSGGRRLTILCYGDSTTHGSCAMRSPTSVRRYRSRTRWPGLLAEGLSGQARVIEAGLPGRTTVHDDPVEGAHKNGLAVLPAVLETHRPLDVVVLMLGTNDLKARFSLTPADVAAATERLIAAVTNSGTGPDQAAPGVLVVAPAPIEEIGWLGELFAGGRPKSRDLAPRLEAVAARHGCGFLDAGSVAEVDPVDGVHLTKESHAALAEALLAYFREAMG